MKELSPAMCDFKHIIASIPLQLKLYCKFLKIDSGGILEDTKIKFRHDGQDMIEDIGLDGFIIGPGLVLAENIDLQGQSLCRWVAGA